MVLARKQSCKGMSCHVKEVHWKSENGSYRLARLQKVVLLRSLKVVLLRLQFDKKKFKKFVSYIHQIP